MDRSRSLLPHALLAGAVLLLAVLGWPVAAHAADTTVGVAGEGTSVFSPADVTVHPGDTVTWKWTADEHHTVSFDDPNVPSGICDRVIESCKGYTHAVTFGQVGTYTYADRFSESTGVVRVVEPEPDPTTEDPPESEDPGSGDTGETTEPDGQPTTSPTGDGDDDATSGSGSDTTDDGGSSSSDGADAAPRSGTSGSVGADVVDRETPEASSAGPAVAAAEPDFLEEFPEPQAPTPSEDVGEVALPDDSGGVGRTVWGTIGGLTLLGTMGAFGRVVLVGDPWSA